LLKTIFYIIVVIWVIRKISAYFFRSWVENTVKEHQTKSQQYAGQQQNAQQNRRREGEIFISKKEEKGSTQSDKIGGDYVDYEEIK
jgi:type II secretory pathway pseudopilin PulG